MIKKTAERFLMAMIMAFVILAGASICSAEVGVTDNEILVGCTADLSGPIAFMGQGVTKGARLYFDYINDQGGIHGRKIKLLVEDDGYQSPRAVQGCKKLVTKDKVFCMFMVLGSTGANAMYPFLESRGIPLVCPATQNRALVIPPRKYLFLSDTTYTTLGKVSIEYFNKLGIGNSKVACIYQDDSPGHDWLRGIKIAAKRFGVDVLELPYKRGSVDYSSQITKCKMAGINYVYMYTIVREPAMIMKEAQRQQYRATFITSYASMNNTTLKLCGDSVDYSNGFYGFGAVMNYDNPNPGMKRYMDIATKYGVDYSNSMHCYGFINAMTFVEGLRLAGRDLTREGLVKALETVKDFKSGINPPVTWGPGLRDGARLVGLGKAINGKWNSLLPTGIWLVSEIEEY